MRGLRSRSISVTSKTATAITYVVSESFILDAIEFGLGGDLAEYAARVLHIQERRYRTTGILTAVSKDNVDVVPNFLYSTVFANDKPWGVITENNEDFPELRSLSTKAAIGWHYLSLPPRSLCTAGL